MANCKCGHDPLVVTFYALKDHECVAHAKTATCLCSSVNSRPTVGERSALNAPDVDNLRPRGEKHCSTTLESRDRCVWGRPLR